MAVRKQIIRSERDEERVISAKSEYSVEEIYDYLNNASKRISKKMEIIANQERQSWTHAQLRNSGLK